jgi:voltage-gated potassium channel
MLKTAKDRDGALQRRLRELYNGTKPTAVRFRYALLAFDLATVLFIVLTSFLPRQGLVEVLDVVFGLAILADFCARLYISGNRAREFLYPTTWMDLVAIASFLLPFNSEAAAFLRIMRTLRLLRTYQVLARLRIDFAYFRRNEDVIIAVVNLAVFVFVMTAVVYETQHGANPLISNYADALYFTVTALTTTGFGDIVLTGTLGRIISVIVMIFGVTLFLQLARTLFRPSKVRFACPACGLQRHDPDAVHCKACGTLINIPDEGAD